MPRICDFWMYCVNLGVQIRKGASEMSQKGCRLQQGKAEKRARVH